MSQTDSSLWAARTCRMVTAWCADAPCLVLLLLLLLLPVPLPLLLPAVQTARSTRSPA